MFIIRGVNFDNNISNWHTPMTSIPWSVLAFVIKGKVDYIINGEKIIAEPGDVLHIPEKSYRQGKNYNGKLHQKYTVIFNRKEDLPYSPSFLINDEVIQRRPANFNYMKRRVERLHMEHVENHPYQPYI